MLQIGPHSIDTQAVLAPMVGVTDYPFRVLCGRLGTRLAIAEMVSADASLWTRRKSRWRLASHGGSELNWVQIVGNDPALMADAARRQTDLGADVIDINMGCPAKNVCRKAAGSALLRDEALVADILGAVVAATELPVTLKTRTGWSPEHRNGVNIARIAEDCGIRLLSVHGRTRQCKFNGRAEYDTLRDMVEAVSIPVIANGDINSAAEARQVLEFTGADAVMVGRAAQGRPWLVGEIDRCLREGGREQPPERRYLNALMLDHLEALHAFYGVSNGARIARKHIGWYLEDQPDSKAFLKSFYQLERADLQLRTLEQYLESLPNTHLAA